MLARVFALRNAFVLRSAPATERELNALRTALVLTFAFSAALDVELRVVLRVAFRVELLCARPLTELLGVLRVAKDRVAVFPCVERAMLPPRGLDRADE